MKEYFDRIRNRMEATTITENVNNYYMGYIAGLFEVGFLSMDEKTELDKIRKVEHMKVIKGV